MQRYRVKDSWFKKYTTTRLPWSSHEIPFWKPLLCFDSGVILLDTGGKELLLFDPTTERVRSVVVRDITAMYSNRESYFETIASLGSTTYLERKITDETAKNPKRQRFRIASGWTLVFTTMLQVQMQGPPSRVIEKDHVQLGILDNMAR
ncbi:hypothetical protein C5167_042764 [Papaver somniferum]|uniref:Uncharacterized protein n=1 Tax=Papaver somniferum TaxID=3469 RepID=A0A4Y7L731_PAPSO|nr:hypothetical protein C5167_042764 [Papaver somniferum]